MYRASQDQLQIRQRLSAISSPPISDVSWKYRDGRYLIVAPSNNVFPVLILPAGTEGEITGQH
jgi:hypothetical protein